MIKREAVSDRSSGIVLCLVIPIIIGKSASYQNGRILYGNFGIVSLAVVVVVGRVSYGAMLGFTGCGNRNIQAVGAGEDRICVLCSIEVLSVRRNFKDLVVTTVVAAFHVLILVVSKDLVRHRVIFVVYLVMLYVANPSTTVYFAGLGAKLRSSCGISFCLRTLRRVSMWGEIHSGTL